MEQSCEFCGKLAVNDNSYRQHRVRCHSNPDKKAIKPSYGNRGKVASESTRLKLSAASRRMHDEGRWTPPPVVFGRSHTEEVKLKLSRSMLGNRNANHRGDRQSYYRGIRMDSSWEVKAAEWLDEMGLRWLYSPGGFELSDGRFYYPDFFVYDEEWNIDYLIEVKGFFRDENRLKFELFQRDYPELEIRLWEKNELRALGVL